MTKYAKSFLFTCILSQSIATAFATPAQLDTAQKIVQLTQLENEFNTNVSNLQSMYISQATKLVTDYTNHQTLTAADNQAIEKIIQLFNKNTATIAKSVDVKQVGSEIYRQNYTEEELQAYKKFLESPEGLSIIKKMPTFSSNFNQAITQKTQMVSTQQNMTEKTNQEIGQILSVLPKGK
ncbi:DUF2059 domain-containing protein [Acinetobacter sp. B5B]|uniref:DUF2059 domain-containing protein n=1 Tax=Acinetobacter baretiae TaxID=2605383 RepID=UPI0018C321D1|nr:DUF2059 domain-containing protein [Acinetobacter baretiae]MBF7683273.1 DUF2059 domain-containing protein [Acinetobacter baretiae]MBF7684465.1 DUF2059 domain-containing protein [Acinetobacter baretiae]